MVSYVSYGLIYTYYKVALVYITYYSGALVYTTTVGPWYTLL